MVINILDEREKTHGDYRNVAACAQELKQVIRTQTNWEAMPLTMRESLDLICTKIARICNGDPNDADHWGDIGGYARLVTRAQDRTQVERILG